MLPRRKFTMMLKITANSHITFLVLGAMAGLIAHDHPIGAIPVYHFFIRYCLYAAICYLPSPSTQE